MASGEDSGSGDTLILVCPMTYSRFNPLYLFISKGHDLKGHVVSPILVTRAQSNNKRKIQVNFASPSKNGDRKKREKKERKKNLFNFL